MAPVITMPREEADRRLREISSELRLSPEEFAERARLGVLTDEQWERRDELITLLFLTGSPVHID